ncbi:MAG TPA: T9SS type A sorting domain-containing protein [Flavobacterium sp.]|jgi:hypothetical protein
MNTNYNSLKAIAAALLLSAPAWSQTALVRWNFNGPSDITVPGGAMTPTPSFGTGSAQLTGGVTSIFNTGNTSTGTSETETVTPPNYAWQTTGYPAPGTGNKTAGVQFNVDTSGFTGITFSFEQRLSNKAGNTYVVQYTLNSTANPVIWVDAETFSVTPAPTGAGDTWYNNRSVNLSAITALNNNPNAAFRIVGAFDPGAGDYLAARSTSTYDGTGTVRFDMVNIAAGGVLGIDDLTAEKSAFTISPNPTRNGVVQFNIAQDIVVYDSLGKLMHSAKNVMSVDTKSYTPGVYFIKTGTGITKKLIVE